MAKNLDGSQSHPWTLYVILRHIGRHPSQSETLWCVLNDGIIGRFVFPWFFHFYSSLLDLRLSNVLFSSLFITLDRSGFGKTPTLHLPRAKRAGSLPKPPRCRRAGRAYKTRTLHLPGAERAGSLLKLPPSRPEQENADPAIAQSGASGFASQAAAEQQNTDSTLAQSRL